eukprot:TRINITY_DN2321_c0_g1_i5.p1 TRINITY_DN2321_c0_g1~~TRINITY_DN2321_c0_g1_i5.p1  ORF type:complete len:388 (-),score=25.15 TRINITY_DN2321_c0_g1_i5:181-1344(-)
MSMIYCDLIALIGVMFTMLGPYVLVIIGRLVVGFTIGINCTAVTMYINEVSPASLSGLMGAQWQTYVNVGIEMTNFVGFGRPSIEEAKEQGMGNNFWRIQFMVPFIVIGIRLLGLLTCFTYETPHYLVTQGQNDEARKVIEKLYSSEVVEAEMQKVEEKAKRIQDEPIGNLFKKHYIKRTLTGMILAFLQQFSGVNAVVFYSTNIFVKGNNPSQDSLNKGLYMSCGVGGALFISPFMAGFILTKFGRKTILILGEAIMVVNLFILAGLSFADLDNASIAFIMIYCVGFGISLGPIVWLYVPEILPEKGVALATASNWFFTTVIAVGYQYLKDGITLGGTFIFFGVWCVLGLLFCIFVVKETAGKTSEEILQAFGGQEQLIEDKNLSQ